MRKNAEVEVGLKQEADEACGRCGGKKEGERMQSGKAKQCSAVVAEDGTRRRRSVVDGDEVETQSALRNELGRESRKKCLCRRIRGVCVYTAPLARSRRVHLCSRMDRREHPVGVSVCAAKKWRERTANLGVREIGKYQTAHTQPASQTLS